MVYEIKDAIVKANSLHGQITLKHKCSLCGQNTLFNVSADSLKIYARGGFVQDAFPELDAALRELFLSGFCNTCFFDVAKEQPTADDIAWLQCFELDEDCIDFEDGAEVRLSCAKCEIVHTVYLTERAILQIPKQYRNNLGLGGPRYTSHCPSCRVSMTRMNMFPQRSH